MKIGRQEKAQKRLVEDWNKDFPVGTDVLVTKDDNSKVSTKTRSEAFMLGANGDYPGHTAVIILEDISGAYLLTVFKFPEYHS